MVMKFYYRSILLFFGIICLGLSVILFKEIRIGAQTLPPDVGLVTQLTGEATYWNETYQKTPEKAQVFMKIRRGDHFKVVSGTMIQLVYFQNGRQETWKGLAELVVGDGESRIEGEKGAQVKPEVLILPVDTSQGMRRIPVLLRRARLSRSGAMQVRGAGEASQKAIIPSREERAEIAMARETYQKLRKQTKADDITPELNLLGIFADYEKYEEMEKVIKEALKIQPDNEVLKDLEEWVRAQKSKPATKK
jgi:hypothetical protein